MTSLNDGCVEQYVRFTLTGNGCSADINTSGSDPCAQSMYVYIIVITTHD